jgi:hypothetical protein
VFNASPRPLCPRERPGTHFIWGWLAPWPVWTGAENVATTGIQSPENPARITLPNSLVTVGPMNPESSFQCRFRCTVQTFNSWHIATPRARYCREGSSVMFIPYTVNRQLATLSQQRAQYWSLNICIIHVMSHWVVLNVSVHDSSSSGNRTKAIPRNTNLANFVRSWRDVQESVTTQTAYQDPAHLYSYCTKKFLSFNYLTLLEHLNCVFEWLLWFYAVLLWFGSPTVVPCGLKHVRTFSVIL